MRKYTDGKCIYYVSKLLGDNQYAVCKKDIGSNKMGIHKYRNSSNKVVETAEQAQKYLDSLAKKKNWSETHEY